MAREICVVSYNPDWPEQFQAEANDIIEVLGENAISTHHIGSTAIPGIFAKPTIDILLVVKSHTFLDANQDAFRTLGYQPMGENGIPGRRYFRKLAGEQHLFHVHAFEVGHPDIARHLDFRDYLRSHPEEARAYAAMKVGLAARHRYDAVRYSEGKADFIQEIDRRAAAWRLAGG